MSMDIKVIRDSTKIMKILQVSERGGAAAKPPRASEWTAEKKIQELYKH
jgi:hypothetical protein